MNKLQFGKRTMSKRCMAVFVCLCMVSTLLGSLPLSGLNAAAVQLEKPMHIFMRHWHADGSINIIDYCLTADGLYEFNDPVYNVVENGDAGLVECGITIDGASITIDTDAVIDQSGIEEKLSGVAVSAGQEAVTANEGNKKVTVTYDPKVNLVKAHFFYGPNSTSVTGLDFDGGSNLEGELAEEYAKVVGADPLEADVVYADGSLVHSTDLGLHTDKTVHVTEGSEDGRTFDLTLEAWNTAMFKARVGMVLDASGSMAFISDYSDATGAPNLEVIEFGDNIDEAKTTDPAKPVFNVPTWDGKGTVPIKAYEYITQDDLDKILNPNLTDNSKLGYSDYKYYVFNKRSDTKEFTALGY